VSRSPRVKQTPKGPEAIGNILSELMARRGYARVQSAQAYEEAWKEAVGPLAAKYSRAGQVRRGALEAIVANSTMLQELVFEKQNLIKTLNGLMPEEGIKDIRFRLGALQ
jgi:hypothetical protein